MVGYCCSWQHTHTHTVGLLWTRDRPLAQTCTCTTHNAYKRQISTPQPEFEPAIPASERPLRSACLKPAKEKYFCLYYQRFRVTCCLRNVFMNVETAGFSKTLATPIKLQVLYKPSNYRCYTNHQTTGVTQTSTFWNLILSTSSNIEFYMSSEMWRLWASCYQRFEVSQCLLLFQVKASSIFSTTLKNSSLA
jgi:hypothetical protein